MMRNIAFIAMLFLCACGVTDDKKEKQSEIVVLSEKIKNDPTNTDLLLERIAYNNKKEYDESVLFDAKQCLSIDSTNAHFHYLLATAYFNISKKNHAKSDYPYLALSHLNKATVLDSQDDKLFALKGELLIAFVKYKEAIIAFNQSLELNYNQEKTHLLMGYSFKQLAQQDRAINCFRNALNINPEYKESYVQLGQMYHLMQDTLAVLYYNNALRIDSADVITLYNKALFFQQTKKYNAAIEGYADLFRVDAFHSNGHYNLGFIHMELGLHDVATNNFSDAIYSNSEFYEAYYSRGNCFETLGNIAQAESDYKRAIEINPEYAFAIEALKNIQKKNIKYNK